VDRIIPYVEPIFRFCYKRLSNRYDAEDLAGEIICHILSGLNKYEIKSLNGWVWRVAHNRYARFMDARSKSQAMLACEEELFEIADYAEVDEDETEAQFEAIFRYLHTLSAKYRDIFVDYYVGELSVKSLAEKYSLPENTVKWRLNVGRQKIRDRIGEDQMDKVYRRINWDTTSCNGDMDSDRYLHTQLSRAICLAAYEKPLTVEEISLATGIPTMYVEDELPRLEYGDAISRVGDKYVTDFIIFSLKDREQVEAFSSPSVCTLADRLEAQLKKAAEKLSSEDFYGSSFGMDKLGYIAAPYLLRRRIRRVKNGRLGLAGGPYLPRKDGGYGWFIVEETVDAEEIRLDNRSGCNVAVEEDCARFYYYWINRYFDYSIYGQGTRRMAALNLSKHIVNGTIPKTALEDEDAADLIANHLISRTEDGYSLNFPCFTGEQFDRFVSLFDETDEVVDDLLAEWITGVRQSFARFVPKHLHGQINQWLGSYVYQIVGLVTEELIRRGTLAHPDANKPLTDGVFCVVGKDVNP